MDQLRPVGTAIIERLDIADDQQHLDIAAGTSEPARTRIAKAAMAKASAYEEDGKVRIPGVARCIIGTK